LNRTKAKHDEEDQQTILSGVFRQYFETECRSYSMMTYLLVSFIVVQVLFTLPYIAFSSKR